MYKWIEANGWQLNLIYGPTSFRKSLLKNKKFIKKIIEGFPKDDWNDLLSKNIIQYVDPTLLKDKQFIFEIFKLFFIFLFDLSQNN